MSELFLRLLDVLPSFRIPPSQPRPVFNVWFFQVARNLLVDRVRQEKRRTDLQLDWGLPADPRESAEARLQREEVRRALARLTEEQREVLGLRFFAGLTHEETARTLGKSVRTIKGLQHRGLQVLARTLRSGLS